MIRAQMGVRDVSSSGPVKDHGVRSDQNNPNPQGSQATSRQLTASSTSPLKFNRHSPRVENSP